MAGKKSNARVKIQFRSTASPHRYTSTMNKRNRQNKGQNEKLKLMKYDPVVRKHVEYVAEEKISK